MTMRCAVLLAAVLSAAVLAGEPVQPQTLLTVRGKLLKEEAFKEDAALRDKKNWYIYKGKYEIVNEQLKVSEQKEDGHHPAMSCKLPAKNMVMQCKFKVDTSKWLGLSLDNGKMKEHIYRAMINPNGVSLKRMSGMGPTTKGENVAEKKFKFEPGTWYTLIVEVCEKETCAQIPEAGIVIYGAHDMIAQEKDRFELISGGEGAWFDELKVWEATPNPKWPAIKATLPVPTASKK